MRQHDIKFEEDNWESPTLGAWGVGWEVWLDGLEITQFTYFQQAGGLDVRPVAAEITYGLGHDQVGLEILATEGRRVEIGERDGDAGYGVSRMSPRIISWWWSARG